MKDDCSRIQAEILASDGFFSQTVEQHCKKCKDCRNMKQKWLDLSGLESAAEVPLKNDFAVIRAAQKLTSNRKRQVLIRRILGYTAAAASSMAAVYTVIFGGDIADNVLHRYWHWDSFEERLFVIDTATEVSLLDITVKNDPLSQFIEEEITIGKEEI